MGSPNSRRVYNIVLYQVALSVVIGAIIGYVARKVLRYAEERGLIDHESFLSFGVSLTFLTLGIVGMIGSDDILCCFIVGNSFTWDDWFRVETEDHAFQDVIDQLLNNVGAQLIGSNSRPPGHLHLHWLHYAVERVWQVLGPFAVASGRPRDLRHSSPPPSLGHPSCGWLKVDSC